MSERFRKLFPTIVSEGSLAGGASLKKRLLDDIRAFSAQDKMGRAWSKENYRSGYTSYGSLSDLHHRYPSFSDLEKKLNPLARAFSREMGWAKELEIEMSACWANVMEEGAYHTLHLHPHSILSGTYYVSVPSGSSGLRIEDPRMAFYMQAPVGKAPLYYSVAPKEGAFVLFESWLRHEVPPNQSKKPRVSVSFNYSISNA